MDKNNTPQAIMKEAERLCKEIQDLVNEKIEIPEEKVNWDNKDAYVRTITQKILKDENGNPYFGEGVIAYHPRVFLRLANGLYSPDKGWTLNDYTKLEEVEETGEGQPWEKQQPRPLEKEIERPRFPMESVPEPYRTFIYDTAESLQVPTDMMGVSVLAVLSGCLQGGYQVQAKRDFKVPMGLYVQVIAEPGERKSAVYDKAVAPIRNIYNKKVKAYRKQAAEDNVDLEILNGEKDQLTRQATTLRKKKGAQDPEFVDMRKRLIQIDQEIDALEKQQPPVYYLDNATPEAMAQEIARNDGRMIIMSDEGDIVEILNGAYTKNHSMLGVVLKGHTGGEMMIHRVNRQPVHLPNINLTVLLMMQPQLVDKMMGSEDMRGRGLTDRFLYTMPKTMVGNRNMADALEVPEEVEEKYNQAVKHLFKQGLKAVEKGKLHTIHLEDEAKRRFQQYEASFERRLKGDLKDLQGWGSKIGGHMLRITGILHAAQNPDAICETPVAPKTVSDAFHLAEYFAEYARIVYNKSGIDLKMQKCKEILQYLHLYHHELESFTLRGLFRRRKFGHKKQEEIEVYLNILEDYGYLKRELEKTTKPSWVYHLHPMLMDDDFFKKEED